MNTLITQGVNNSNKMFAIGSMSYASSSIMVHGLVQCTQDQSKDDCYLCLQDFVRKIPSFCYGVYGGRILGTTCNIRYESYAFVNDTSVPNAEPSKKGNSGTSFLFWHTCLHSILLIALHECEIKSENLYLFYLFFKKIKVLVGVFGEEDSQINNLIK